MEDEFIIMPSTHLASFAKVDGRRVISLYA